MSRNIINFITVSMAKVVLHCVVFTTKNLFLYLHLFDHMREQNMTNIYSSIDSFYIFQCALMLKTHSLPYFNHLATERRIVDGRYPYSKCTAQ